MITIRGYRGSDAALLTGPWLAGELISHAGGSTRHPRSGLYCEVSVAPPQDAHEEICVLPDSGFVRYADIDWVHRRARLEIGLRPDSRVPVADVLAAAVAHGFGVLNLHRLYGWVTPAAGLATDALAWAEFTHEASVPAGVWFEGRLADRELWGVVRHD